jgi:nucleotide-binding universal stress UspA family protein
MRALVWIEQDTWPATVAAAARLPAEAELTLLHVAPADVESVATGARHGLLGRPRPRDRGPGSGLPAPLAQISDAESEALLDEAAAALGRPAALEHRRGRVERELVDAAAGADLLVLARDGDGDRAHPGPHSLAPHARYVVDHAPCAVLLVWP